MSSIHNVCSDQSSNFTVCACVLVMLWVARQNGIHKCLLKVSNHCHYLVDNNTTCSNGHTRHSRKGIQNNDQVYIRVGNE